MRKYFQFPWWLTTTIILAFLVRIPSFLEPFYYGDEMIYLALGEGIRKGLVLYKNVHDNKPPLLYFLAAISGNVFWFRVLLCMWMLVTIVVFWHLSKTLFKNKNTATAATILFAFLTSLPLFEGFVANAELFMILPTLIAFLFAIKGNSYKTAFISGLFLSLAALFKIPSIFDVAAVIGVWLFILQFKKTALKDFILKTALLGVGLFVPIALSFAWYAARGAFHEYLEAAFLQNFGYVSSWRASTAQVSFLTKNGPLLVRGVIVLISFVILFVLRQKRSKTFVVVSAWLVTSLFAATLSERPYPHYFLQILPSASLLLAMLVTDETIEQVLVIFPLSLFFFTAVYFNFWQYSSSLYFGRFQTLLTQGQTEYFHQFSPLLSRNYEIAKIITADTHENDSVFVWGDSAGIYALSKRLPPIKYVADYHIRDFSSEEETYNTLVNNPPKMIVVLSEAAPFDSLSQFVKSHYAPVESPSGATIWYNTSQ